ncbi:MAG: hypothetical protein KF718_03630 [Polyangiaceae bacterium]|nr:hypothetical protein [Polyangiaceae bacterium]
MRAVLVAATLVFSSGCRTDTHSAAPERGPQPASPAGTTVPADEESNEMLDDNETSLHKTRNMMERTLARFRAEPVDAAWAGSTQGAIEALRDDLSPDLPATVKAGTVECRQTTCLFEHADESTVLPLRPLLTRKVYGQLRAQGYECAMAQHPWTHPDGSVVERNYFMFRR